MAQERLRYDTLLLDFHGTFTCHRGRVAHSLNNAYRQILNRNITREEFQAIFQRDEDVSVSDSLNRMIDGQLSEEDKKRLIGIYRQQEKVVYVPKHQYLISHFKALGTSCIIVSNGEERTIRRLLEHWRLLDSIDEIYGRGSDSLLAKNSIPKKPHPATIDFIIEHLRHQGHGIRRERTLMVGDHQHDIGAGNSAGIHTAFLVTGPNQMPEYYDMRPTYALLDLPTIRPAASKWLKRENVHSIRDLPKIITGEI